MTFKKCCKTVMISPLQKLLQRRRAAQVLMWLCLCGVLLPISAALLGFLWYGIIHTTPMAGFHWAMSVNFLWPIPVIAFLGFFVALEWKQGLEERIKRIQPEGQ